MRQASKRVPDSAEKTVRDIRRADPSNPGADWDPEIDVLRLVQPLPGGWDRGSGGWQAETAADLEQDPRRDRHGDRQSGP